MFCSQCGTQLQDADKFCSNCGNKIGQSKSAQSTKSNWPDLGEFGVHTSYLNKFLARSAVKTLQKYAIKGIEKNFPDLFDAEMAAIQIKGEGTSPDFQDIEESLSNSPRRDSWRKTPLVALRDDCPNSVLGVFRVASNSKGVTQEQGENNCWGHTDWLIFLRDEILLINDFINNPISAKLAENYKRIKYSDISQVIYSHDHLGISDALSSSNYFFMTFEIYLSSGATYSRALLLGQGEDERNNNIYKSLLLYSFFAWKLRIDLNNDIITQVEGSSQTSQIKPMFGVFKEVLGD